MDPLTAALQVALETLKLANKIVDGQPPEVRAKLWELHLRQAERWDAFCAMLAEKLTPPE